MRFILLAAASALTLAACNKPTEAPATPAPAAPEAAAPMAAAPAADAGHDMSNMPGMDANAMAASAAGDAGPLQLTPDNHMFHVLPGTKEEKVVLPASGVWTPDKPSTDDYSLKDSANAKLADGTDVVVFTFLMQKPSTTTVVFTKRATSNPADKAEDTRTVMFMIH
jgi:hypothetical protein